MVERIQSYMQELSWLKVTRYLLMVFLVVFPFQIRTLVFQMSYFPTGNFNEYASFFVYLSDLLVLGAFVAFGMAVYREEIKKIQYGYGPLTLALLVFLLVLNVSVLGAEFRMLSLWQMFRFGELFLLYFLLVNEVLNRREVLRFFLYGMLAQSAIALAQYLLQSSLGLRFLGEPVVSSELPGVAKVDLDGMTLLRSYGTFPHPNIFGGLLVVAILWASYIFRKNLWMFVSVGVLLLAALLFTFSRSAFLAFAGGLLVLFSLTERKVKMKHVLLSGSILLFLIVLFNLEAVLVERLFTGDDPQATIERVEYMRASRDMLLDRPMGVGLGHFTLFMQDYVPVKLAPWVMQPVHNVYLLLVNEGGMVAGLAFVVLLGVLFFQLLRVSRQGKEDQRMFAHLLITVLMVIAVISLFDHYFFTLYAGQVFLFLYFALVSNCLKSSLLPRKKS